jgi:hypothetical protein
MSWLHRTIFRVYTILKGNLTIHTELLDLFWTLFIVLYVEDKKYNVSETGSVSVLRWMGQDKPTQYTHVYKIIIIINTRK